MNSMAREGAELAGAVAALGEGLCCLMGVEVLMVVVVVWGVTLGTPSVLACERMEMFACGFTDGCA